MTKRRRNAHAGQGIFQSRLNDLWPTEVREALRRERAGEQISPAEQAFLMGIVVSAIQGMQGADPPPPSESWVEIRIIGGRLHVYRLKEGSEPEYLGMLGRR